MGKFKGIACDWVGLWWRVDGAWGSCLFRINERG